MKRKSTARSRASAAAAQSDLPAPGVWPLEARTAVQLRRWADQAGHRMVEVTFDAAGDRRAALRAIGRAFAFPVWFGANLDALYDCLTDLPEHGAARGCVVILEHFSAHPVLGGEQGAAVLDVFRDAAAELAAQGFALRVFCG